VISCSLRNNFSVSLGVEATRGRATSFLRGSFDLPREAKLRILVV